MPKLIFIDAPFAGRVYDLTAEKVTVGRGDQNTLAIHDPSVSLQHCEILVHDPEVIVRDLGSSNGTFVEGVRLHNQQSQLRSGETVRFGTVSARLELDPQRFAKDTSDQTAIHELGRILRDQRWAQNHPKPADASMKLDPHEGSPPDEQTTVMRRSAPTAIGPAHEVANEPEKPAEKKNRLPLWLVGGLLVLLLIALAWLFWRRG